MQAWIVKILSAVGVDLITKVGSFIWDLIVGKKKDSEREGTMMSREKILSEMALINAKTEKTAGDKVKLKELHKLLNASKE
jgi:hypothetical protein